MVKRLKEWKNKTAKKKYLQELMRDEETLPLSYEMKDTYNLGQYIKHPKFGVGFIQGTIGPKKIAVFFEQFEKVLLQNWI